MSRRSSLLPRTWTASGTSTSSSRPAASIRGSTVAAASRTTRDRLMTGKVLGLPLARQRFLAGEIEELIDEASHLRELPLDCAPVGVAGELGALQSQVEDCERRAQLVRGIRCEPPLRGVGAREAIEGAVDGLDQGLDLPGQSTGRDAHVRPLRPDPRGLLRGALDRPQAPSADQPDEDEPEQRERHDDRELLGAFLEQAVDELVTIVIAAADEHGRALRAASRDDGPARRGPRR